MSEDWSSRVANPDKLGEAEKKFWREAEPRIKALFEELKNNGRIETVYVEAEYDHLRSVLHRLDLASRIYNVMIHTSDNLDKARKFLDANKEFGIDEQISMGMLTEAGLFVDLLSTELFKLVILFHIKGTSEDYSVSRFAATMQSLAPNSWEGLREYVDSDFRNAGRPAL